MDKTIQDLDSFGSSIFQLLPVSRSQPKCREFFSFLTFCFTMETPSFRILVIGAGIVGLSTAISLNLKGHQVTILEKAALLRPIGGVINCPPNSSRVLEAYGLSDLIVPKVDYRMKSLRFRRYNTAEILSHLNADVVESDYGAP